MGGVEDLEARIRVLEDTEAIRKLKAKYWRTLDKKLWDENAECFTGDFVFDFPPDLKVVGRKEFVTFLKGMFDRATAITTHQGHQAEIDILSETTARAIWALRDNNIDLEAGTEMWGRGHYEEEYVKENETWRIKHMTLSYLLHDNTNRAFGRVVSSAAGERTAAASRRDA